MNNISENSVTSTEKTYSLNIVRGLAIVLVMAHHQFFFVGNNEITHGLLEGGWLGVDLFFALSGFLITGILIKIFYGQSKQTLTIFFQNRVKRLAPALLVFLAFWTILVLLNIAGLQRILAISYNGSAEVLPTVIWGVLSPIFGFANYAIMFFSFPVSLGHLWSLAIEWQFYLLLPILLLFLGVRKRKFSFPQMLSIFVGAYVVLFAVFVLTSTTPMQAYLGSPGRLLALFVGGLAAVVASPVFAHHTQHILSTIRTPRFLAGILSVLLIILSIAWISADKSSLGVLTFLMPLTGILSAVLVFFFAHIPNSFFAPASGWKRIFSWVFVLFNWFGQRSYAAYLWNWTLVFVLYSLITENSSLILFDSPAANTVFYFLAIWIVTWIVAEISWWAVERRWILSKKS